MGGQPISNPSTTHPHKFSQFALLPSHPCMAKTQIFPIPAKWLEYTLRMIAKLYPLQFLQKLPSFHSVRPRINTVTVPHVLLGLLASQGATIATIPRPKEMDQFLAENSDRPVLPGTVWTLMPGMILNACKYATSVTNNCRCLAPMARA
jgi:hypothetical protein